MKLRHAVAFVALSGTPPSSAAEAEEGATPPWDDLSSALSSPSLLTVPTVDAFVSECSEPFLTDPAMTSPGSWPSLLEEDSSWKAWTLIDQPSKVCTSSFTCAFDDCYFPELVAPGNVSDAMFTDTAGALGRHEESLSLPARVVHPESIGDVVASLRWAFGNKFPVTVKTSGNHYTGAGTLRGSLNINTRNLPAYSDTSIADCSESAGAGDSIIGRACRLALARNKTGVVRVAGGEVWDLLLRSVVAYNDDPSRGGKAKYMALSGSAGTVAPAGGWMASGGNSGMRGMRQFGMGVDQVLQLEMVLPDGTHVRFGPEEWEEAPGYIYPKTTKVNGYCNEKPEAEENEWVWKECDVVDFNELWMAARGGGGGTWGIVTSLVWQLHQQPGHYHMRFLPLTTDETWKAVLADEAKLNAIDETVEDFKLEYFFNPSALGVDDDDSNACGNDSDCYPNFSLPPWQFTCAGATVCLGESAAEAWATAWRTFLTDGRGKERLLAGGLSGEQIEEMSGWAYGSDWKEQAANFFETSDVPVLSDGGDLAALESSLFNEEPSLFAVQSLQGTPFEGHAASNHPPFVYSPPRYYGMTSAIISIERTLENRDTLVPFLTRMNRDGSPWYLGSKGIVSAHDQMTAIPQSRREGGLYLIFLDLVKWEDAFEAVLPIIFGDLDPNVDAFPGFVGHNHNVRHGPLKNDWTKPCPLSYTLDEMDELCISEQEATWGTELLARLEKFKAEIDPDGIMTCPTGVGFKRAAAKEPALPEYTEDPAPESSSHGFLLRGKHVLFDLSLVLFLFITN